MHTSSETLSGKLTRKLKRKLLDLIENLLLVLKEAQISPRKVVYNVKNIVYNVIVFLLVLVNIVEILMMMIMNC